MKLGGSGSRSSVVKGKPFLPHLKKSSMYEGDGRHRDERAQTSLATSSHTSLKQENDDEFVYVSYWI